MWVEQIVRRGFDAAQAGGARTIDYLDLTWDQCRRVVKKSTRSGEPVRVLLPLGQAVRHGDVLWEDATRAVVVNVTPCELVVATPATIPQAAELALRLGNLHHPVQISGTELLFLDDGPAMAVLARTGIPWSRQQRVFEPTPVETGENPALAEGFRVIRAEDHG